MKLMIAGDLHIGRASSRLPDSVGGADRHRGHTAAAAWGRVVEAAIEQGVDLLLLTGDVADEKNKFFEAIGPLDQGVQRLAEAGVDTFAVAGNHDYDVLPRLADQLRPQQREHFTLLGREGVWQSERVERGSEVLNLIGWSFPQRHVPTSPLDRFPGHVQAACDHEAPTLALVHGDLYDPASRYAPLDLARLRAARGIDAWLLGHIHKPDYMAPPGGGPWVLYPGSLQAMDPGERGAHGVWRCETQAAGVAAPTLLPLSSVRYESVEVDLTGKADQAEFDAAILAAQRQARERVREEGEPGDDALKVLAARLTLGGRTDLVSDLPKMIAEHSGAVQPLDGVEVCIEKMLTHARPNIDLARHASGHTPVAMLAKLVLELDAVEEGEAPGPQAASLMPQALTAIGRTHDAAAFADLPTPAPTDENPARDEATARGVLRDQAMALLGALLDQNPDRAAEPTGEAAEPRIQAAAGGEAR